MFSKHASKEIGKLVKQGRTNAGLTQAALAKKLGYSSSQFVSNWERAASLPPLHKLAKIAKLTKTQYGEFKEVLLKDFEKTLDHY